MGKKKTNFELVNKTSTGEEYVSHSKEKEIKYKFTVNQQMPLKSPYQVGVFRDIIEDVTTGNIEIRQDQNDISHMFSKYLAFRMFTPNGVVNVSDYDKYFNMQQNSAFIGLLNEFVNPNNSNNTLLKPSEYLGIHSWEVGIGSTMWDTPGQFGFDFDYNEYGFTVSKGTSTIIPYSSLKIYADTIEKTYNNIPQYENTNLYHHNCLFTRIPPSMISDSDVLSFYSNDFSLTSYRKPVQVFFVIPTQYFVNENEIVTDPIEILEKLRTGEFVTERVIEWLPYTGFNSLYGIDEKLQSQLNMEYLIPEYIMVQQIFEPYEQNFEWREFGILQGFNKIISGADKYNTVEDEENEPNSDLIYFQQKYGLPKSEFTPLIYPRGVFVDYKVHQVIRKNRNMRITRQIIFGVLNITSSMII